MIIKSKVLVLCCAGMLAVSGCSRQQSDWQKTRETNSADAYEQFLKKYPSGEFTAQAQARVKELYEERDWQKARDADTPEAYQAFLKQYPEGKWTEEARIRVENFTLAQAPAANSPGSADAAGTPSAPTPGADMQGTGALAPDTSPVATKGPAPSPAPSARTATATPSMAAQPSVAHAHIKAAAKAVNGAAGSYGVQLGAFKSGAGAAHERWAHLQKEYPSLLAGLSSKVAKKKTASGTLYRLQATGLTEKRARSLCNHLKAKSQACVVLSGHA